MHVLMDKARGKRKVSRVHPASSVFPGSSSAPLTQVPTHDAHLGKSDAKKTNRVEEDDEVSTRTPSPRPMIHIPSDGSAVSWQSEQSASPRPEWSPSYQSRPELASGVSAGAPAQHVKSCPSIVSVDVTTSRPKQTANRLPLPPGSNGQVAQSPTSEPPYLIHSARRAQSESPHADSAYRISALVQDATLRYTANALNPPVTVTCGSASPVSARSLETVL